MNLKTNLSLLVASLSLASAFACAQPLTFGVEWDGKAATFGSGSHGKAPTIEKETHGYVGQLSDGEGNVGNGFRPVIGKEDHGIAKETHGRVSGDTGSTGTRGGWSGKNEIGNGIRPLASGHETHGLIEHISDGEGNGGGRGGRSGGLQIGHEFGNG